MDTSSPIIHTRPPKPADFTDTTATIFNAMQNNTTQLFSKIIEVYLWVLNLRWYKLFLITIAGIALYVFVDSVFEQQKENRKKTEGMQPARPTPPAKKKKVTFHLDEPVVYPPIYDLVVKPLVYSFSRNIGV
jgi:hypothetical protein